VLATLQGPDEPSMAPHSQDQTMVVAIVQPQALIG